MIGKGVFMDEPVKRQLEIDWVGIGVAMLLAVWLVGVAAAPQAVTWFVVEILFALGYTTPGWVWPGLTFGQGFFMLTPTWAMAIYWHDRPMQPVFALWTVAAAYFLFLFPIRFAGPTAAQLTNLLQIIFSLLFLAGLGLFIWRQKKQHDPNWRPRPLQGHRLVPALLLTPLLLWGWLIFGALGSPLDTVLNLIVGLLVGLIAGISIHFFYVRPLQEMNAHPGWTVLGGGVVVAVALLLLGAGVGHNSMQLFLVWSLPALGWLVMGLTRWPGGKNWLAIAVLVGLNAAAPLMLIDPDEMSLILNLGGRDILAWALYALGGVLLTAFVLTGLVLAGCFYYYRAGWRLPGWARPLGLVAAAVAWGLMLLLYTLAGQPGFHGERLFVILNEQADLSAAAAMSDYDARRQFVYDTLVTTADRSQADIRTTLDRLGVAYTPYYLVNAIEVDGGPFLRLWLNSRPEVDRVLDSTILRPLPAPANTAAGMAAAPTTPQWNLTTIGADRVWAEFGVRGEGILIGQSDSGVQGDHPELAATYRGRATGHDYHWFDPWNHSQAPTDIGGHGTHTLGSIVGQTVGVAPGAEWIGCTNLARNLANPALYLDCMQFMLAPFPLGGDPFRDGDPTRSAQVLNNSWGCPEIEGCDAGSLLPAVRALRAAGIFIVVSAGNEGSAGCETVKHPLAIYEEVFSVGASNEWGDVASFSSLGPVTVDGSGRVKPDILAPGEDVLSAFPNNSYAVQGGTSMAGPHVAGVVALIWSANPALIGQIEATEGILRQTADPYTGAVTDWCGSSAVPNNVAGYGVVNAYAAVARARQGN